MKKPDAPEADADAPQTHADALERVLDAASALSGVVVRDAYREGVRLHLANSLAIAEAIGAVPAEGAACFKA